MQQHLSSRGPDGAATGREPHPHGAAGSELPARRHPVPSHFFSLGLAAGGRANTIVLTGNNLRGVTVASRGVLVSLRRPWGQRVEKQLGSHVPWVLPWRGGRNSAHLAGERPGGLSPAFCVCLPVAKATCPRTHRTFWPAVPVQHLDLSRPGAPGSVNTGASQTRL